MPKVENYYRCTCDRCGHDVFTTKDSPEMQRFKTIRRVDQGDVDTTRYLCQKCANAYRKLAQAQDSAFAEFMAESDE